MTIREALGAQRLSAELARHVHRYDVPPPPAAMEDGDWRPGCRCGKRQDIAKTRRGKSARRRGNDYERSVAERLGAKRVGQYGGKEDVQADWISVQCKNGAAFPERLWSWLQATPANAAQLRALVIGDAPGAGHKRREIIVLELDDFIAWFGARDA